MSTKRGSSREAITVHCYLRPVVSLDSESLQKLKDLLKVTNDLRRQTHHLHTRRIQRGSPGAGALGGTIAQFTPKVNDMASSIEEIATSHRGIPGMELLLSQFKVFHNTLNTPFNDGGNEQGYYDRVQYLEKLMYAAGILRGHVEVVVEQHTHWKARLAGTTPRSIARRLDFNKEADPGDSSSPTLATALGQLTLGAAQPAPGFAVQAQPPPQSPTVPSKSTSEETMSLRVDLPEYMQSGIAHLWETRQHTDVTFLVGHSRVPAHRAILASQSEYFNRLLFGEMIEARAGAEIPLKDTPLKAFQLLLRYAYSGSLEMKDVPIEDVLEIVRLADRFNFTMLKEAIGIRLADRICTDNVLELLVSADYSHLPELQEKCSQFVDRHAEEVLKSETFLSLPAHHLQCVVSRDTFLVPEIAIFEAVLRWKEHNSGTSEEVMSKVLKCIRLSEIPPQEIFSVVEPSGLFDESKVLQAIRVQMTPRLQQMHPRGKRVLSKNLFASSTTTLIDHILVQPSDSHGQYRMPPKAISEGYVRLGNVTVQPATGLGFGGGIQLSQTLQPQRNSSRSSLVISLGDTPYLINNIQFQGYPDMAKGGLHVFGQPATPTFTPGGAFSYTVAVSRDKEKWIQLANYSRYSCYLNQQLHFPTQSARYVRFELTGREDLSQEFTVCFSSCSFVEDLKPFAVRENGVMAPLFPATPAAWLKRLTDQPVCIVNFYQPYSVSRLSFKVCPPETSKVERADLVVAVQSGDRKNYEEVATLERKKLGTDVTVEFKERVVSSVKVVIKERVGLRLVGTVAQLPQQGGGLLLDRTQAQPSQQGGGLFGRTLAQPSQQGGGLLLSGTLSQQLVRPTTTQPSQQGVAAGGQPVSGVFGGLQLAGLQQGATLQVSTSSSTPQPPTSRVQAAEASTDSAPVMYSIKGLTCQAGN